MWFIETKGSHNLAATSSYSYDLNGSLLTEGNRHFAYDDENQLISVLGHERLAQ